MTTYKIIRMYHPSVGKPAEDIKFGLTREEAQAHCKDPNTRVEGKYFDGFTEE